MMGAPENPSKPGWGGRFPRAWERPKRVFDRLTTVDDQIETFGLLELVLPGPKGAAACLVVDGQEFPAAFEGPSSYRFRFVPKSTKRWSYRTKSTAADLDELEGAFTSVDPRPVAAARASEKHPHRWTDDPDRAFAEGPNLVQSPSTDGVKSSCATLPSECFALPIHPVREANRRPSL